MAQNPPTRRTSMLGPTILLGLAFAAFIALGFWQLYRAQLLGNRPPEVTMKLTEVLQPQSPLEGDAAIQPLRVSGTFDSSTQLRVLGGAGTSNVAAADWDITALEVKADSGTALLAVVRGAVPAGAPLPSVPAGEVEVTGRLYSFEGPDRDYAARAGELSTVSGADLKNAWNAPMYSAYLLADQDSTAASAEYIAPPDHQTDWAVQNVFYAVQWWIFASFAVYMWFTVRRDRRSRPSPALEPDAPAPDVAQHR